MVDNSSAFRMAEGVPLVIPEINPEAVAEAGIRAGAGGIIANPNCSTIIMLMAVAPLHRTAGVKRVVVSILNPTANPGSHDQMFLPDFDVSPTLFKCLNCKSLKLTALAWQDTQKFGHARHQSAVNIGVGAGEHVPGSQRRRAGGHGRARTTDAGGAGRPAGHHKHIPLPGAAVVPACFSASSA